jgi:hypothetical protein
VKFSVWEILCSFLFLAVTVVMILLRFLLSLVLISDFAESFASRIERFCSYR